MTTRMLIDARHREETRVAVVNGNRIEEFDFESAERKQLKGNIYLAKVTRVEPSLQAAFVEYGGNRHGFLAFSEIHPDYYQIPKEDRDALLREEAEHAAEEAALRADHDADDEDEDDADDERFEDDGGRDPDAAGDQDHDDDAPRPAARSNGQDDQVEALRQRRTSLRHRYKIQDVIRRRQVLLVQVVKEERGNKGAALTSYLSLAGRYCVLMPNTSHGGGISRKISNAGDRKRLKTIMADLALPPSMGCIVRTAGLQRTKVEIKRDFDYLARLWDGIRENTLSSSAPACIYGDSDLIKRAIRDIYNREIDEVVVEGEEGYRQAKEFMKLLMPSHARKVKHYSDAVPLFQRAHVEEQLAAMYHPVVQLKSGGYLVINPTEALVSIDINSGRSTREHSIEQTATATNLEAAQEIARQLRLRDMAGLVVIDFIDMDNNGNVRKVEKAMKEALKNDRARIQVGRISSFGLMEMSRQRLRTGVLEASTRACPHCEGTGLVRTASSAGLSALRLIEDEAARGRGSLLTLRASQEAAIYVLNRKRADIAEIEDRYGVKVEILPDREEEGAHMSVEASGPPPSHAPRFEAPIEEIEEDIPEDIEIDEDEDVVEDEVEDRADDRAPRQPRAEQEGADRDGDGQKRRRRRRGRRNRNRPEDGAETNGTTDETGTDPEEAGVAEDGEEFVGEAPTHEQTDPQEGGDSRRRRGRRGRRGGRRSGGGEADAATTGDDVATTLDEPADAGDSGPVTSPLDIAAVAAEAKPDAPKTRRRPRARAAAPSVAPEAPPETAVASAPVDAPIEAEADAEAPAKPRRGRRKASATTDVDAAPAKGKWADAKATGGETAPAEAMPVEAMPVEAVPVEAVPAEATSADAPKRRGRTRKPAAETTVAAPVVEEPVEAAPPANDAETDDGEADGAPRRGWWQRTFGA